MYKIIFFITTAIYLLGWGILASACSSPSSVRSSSSNHYINHNFHKKSYNKQHRVASNVPLTTANPQGRSASVHVDHELELAWLKAEQGFYVASETADWQSPLLTASFLPPALYYIRRALFGWRVQGIVGALKWRLGNVHVDEVSKDTAVVTGCSWSLGTTYASTGKATPVDQGGDPGYAVIRSQLAMSSGVWKVTSQQVQGMRTPEGLCKGL